MESFIRTLELPSLYEISWNGLGQHFFYDPAEKIPDTLVVTGMEDLLAHSPDVAKELAAFLHELDACRVELR